MAVTRALKYFRESVLKGFPPGCARRAFGITFGLTVFLFPFGLLFSAGNLLPGEFSWTASVVIVLNGLAVLFSELRRDARSNAIGRFFVLMLLLYCVEWIGVRTGYPFGRYTYTTALGALIAGVPLAIPFAWYATVVNAWHLSSALLPAGGRFLRAGRALMAGLLTVGLDVVLEPFASRVRLYWLWEGDNIPVVNYVSWLAFSSLVVFWLEGTSPRQRREGEVATAVALSGMQFALFVVADLLHGNIVPVVASAVGLSVSALVMNYAVRSNPVGRS